VSECVSKLERKNHPIYLRVNVKVILKLILQMQCVKWMGLNWLSIGSTVWF